MYFQNQSHDLFLCSDQHSHNHFHLKTAYWVVVLQILYIALFFFDSDTCGPSFFSYVVFITSWLTWDIIHSTWCVKIRDGRSSMVENILEGCGLFVNRCNVEFGLQFSKEVVCRWVVWCIESGMCMVFFSCGCVWGFVSVKVALNDVRWVAI